jgi:alkanesulfonate monooxygenase
VTSLRVYSTCPMWTPEVAADYDVRVRRIAEWSEAAGHEGMLIYTDNRLVDPWLLAQAVLAATTRLEPLVALQPAYMHPFTAAKMAASLVALHGRRIQINLVSGGFRNDLIALGDELEHDERYERIVEYGSILRALFTNPRGVVHNGRWYTLRGVHLLPPVPPELVPEIMVSGSSPASVAAARALGGYSMRYPEQTPSAPDDGPFGIRIGIVTRPEAEDAWEEARRRFPADRVGELAHAVAARLSDSSWHRQLSSLELVNGSTYWLHPFKTYKTFCPYLVGSYDELARDLRDWRAVGLTALILDVPSSREDLEHIGVVLEKAFA